MRVGGSEDILEEMKAAGIDFLCMIPCISIQGLIKLVEAELDTFQVTREEEAVGICAGAYLTGKRPAIIMQNSGLGNSVNAFKSLIELYGIPLPLIISQRGHDKEWISGQIPMGAGALKDFKKLLSDPLPGRSAD